MELQRQRREIIDDFLSVRGEHRFRVELNPVPGRAEPARAHDLALIAPGVGDQFAGFADFADERMISTGHEPVGEAGKESRPVMPDRRGLEFIINQVAKDNPKAKSQTPESLRLLDGSVLDEIRKSGFIDKFKK